MHLVGCLGNGMAELARLYAGLGWTVSGSDARAADPDAQAVLRGAFVDPACNLDEGAYRILAMPTLREGPTPLDAPQRPPRHAQRER